MQTQCQPETGEILMQVHVHAFLKKQHILKYS